MKAMCTTLWLWSSKHWHNPVVAEQQALDTFHYAPQQHWGFLIMGIYRAQPCGFGATPWAQLCGCTAKTLWLWNSMHWVPGALGLLRAVSCGAASIGHQPVVAGLGTTFFEG